MNDRTVKIEFSTYSYALINEKDINTSLVFPVTSEENPSGEESNNTINFPYNHLQVDLPQSGPLME
ncbi:hypothetical protein [Bacillus cereus group sp. BfR-BA-01383]|uniref:hypothetical protein n=1 Tax=Bacillus cereus group sp. BfR-BA-01383 TaxID=2920327 RepID=UPI001F5A49B4|nr:hypothetical protein [Bacillus cereus group sp. BfR-BA-01383]